MGDVVSRLDSTESTGDGVLSRLAIYASVNANMSFLLRRLIWVTDV